MPRSRWHRDAHVGGGLGSRRHPQIAVTDGRGGPTWIAPITALLKARSVRANNRADTARKAVAASSAIRRLLEQTGVYWAGGVGPLRPLDFAGPATSCPWWRSGQVVGRRRRSGARRRGFHVGAGNPPVQPGGEPPVGLTEQLHDRGDQDHADQGGVDEDGDGQAEAEHVEDARRVADDEGPEDADHGGGRRGDDPAGGGDPVGYGGARVAAVAPFLLDA